MENSLSSLYLPEGLLSFFEVTYFCEFCKIDTKERGILIHLVEQNILPDGYSAVDYESKGFTEAALIQDFPIRGKLVFLSIRKRRWRKKDNKSEVFKRDHSFISEGIQMTSELSAFLKGSDRDPGRYDVEYL
jgi:hypothetical protein